MKREIRSISTKEIDDLIIEEPDFQEYHIEALYRYLYQDGLDDFSDMRYLPRKMRKILTERYYISPPLINEKMVSEYDKTTKFIVEYEDKKRVEMVYLPHRDWNSLCISTQVGCKRGCLFCATGLMGFYRDLYWGEILDQVRLARSVGDEFRNIVIMGMGEPLDNYDEVVRAVRFLMDVYSFGRRRITLSTIGVIEGLKSLKDEGLGIRLALSLNATTTEKRRELMPASVGEREQLLRLLAEYGAQYDDMVTIEYVLIDGINDSEGDARKLLRLLKGYRFKVNIIEYNKSEGIRYDNPSEERVMRFVEVMREYASPVMLRDSKGSDIQGACGQLATMMDSERD